MKLWITFAAVTALATVASAQNANAFKTVDGFTGVTVRQTGSMFELMLGHDATVTFNGRTHDIKNVDGFWLISDTGKLNATMNPITDWNIHVNEGGAGSTAGWQTQQKNAIKPGESKIFTFSNVNLSVANAIGLKLHANGTPAHVRLDTQPVPEPASMLALTTGCIALLRKRRKK